MRAPDPAENYFEFAIKFVHMYCILYTNSKVIPQSARPVLNLIPSDLKPQGKCNMVRIRLWYN
jgi:hypothetical protein